MKNYIGIIVTIAIFLIGGVIGAGKLIADTNNLVKRVDKAESKIEILTTATDKMDVKQEVIKEKIEDTNQKLDKLTDLLIKLEEKKNELTRNNNR